jgi:hypothetical protein
MLKLTKLYDLEAIGIKDTAMRVLGSVQNERPEAVVAGVAALFISICERYHVDVRRVLETTDRILRDAREKHPVEMRAMARYIREELPHA